MKLLYTFLLALITPMVYSQSIVSDSTVEKPTVYVIARSFGDSIVLRWGTSTPLGWKLSNEKGFTIERYTLLQDGKFDKKKAPEKIVLNTEPIKPWPLEKWEGLSKKNDFAAIAAQALYGDNFEMVNMKTGGVMQAVSLSQEQEARHNTALFSADQSLAVAEACGLKFTDKKVNRNEKYVYKIYSNVPVTTYAIDTGFVFIGANEQTPLPKPVQLNAESGDRVVMLSWNKIYFKHIYSNYIIERSTNGGNTFEKIQGLPIVNTSPGKVSNAENIYKIDSLPENNKLYVYRVRGITPFEEISPASDTVQGTGKPASLGLSPYIIKVQNLKDGSIKIDWKYPAEFNTKIKEFEIIRSMTANGEYKSVSKAASSTREFVDTKPERVNYYIVRTIEANGAYSSSFPALGQIADSIPPSAPEGLKAEIDTKGKLTLKWKKGKESDISGYRVYMANGANEEYTQITKEAVRDTAFTGTININTITSSVYFKVMAEDLNYNQSLFSEALKIARPDIVPPVAPVIKTYNSSDSAIYIQWIASTSNDVVKHIVYRKEKYSVQWQSVFETKEKISEYYDKNLSSKTEYQYVVVAEDDAGLESERRQIITVSLIDFGFRPVIKEISPKVDRMKKQVELTWVYEQKPEKFLIYRSVKGSPLRLYKSVDGSARTFVDKIVTMNTDYVYKIQADFPDGGRSPLSEAININY